MSKPAKCSDDLYSLMMWMWQANPTVRPSFSEIVVNLDNMIKGVTEPEVVPDIKKDVTKTTYTNLHAVETAQIYN